MIQRWIARYLVVSLFLLPAMANAQRPTASSDDVAGEPAPRRLIVKLRGELAAQVETSAPLPTLTLPADQAGPAAPFFRQHGLRSLTPVYPELVRARKLEGPANRLNAAAIRLRFPERAKRLRGTFQPPDLWRTYIVELDERFSRDVSAALQELRGDPNVAYAEDDKVISVGTTPNDPYLSSSGSWGQSYEDLWGIWEIGAPTAWNTTTGAGVVIAVIDTGIDYNHADIASNVWANTREIPGNGIDDDGNGFVDDVRGWDFVYYGNNPLDLHGHGTHVAGTAAAAGNNGIGVAGVAWGAKVMPLRALDANGNGYDGWIAAAVVYAANNGADVINLSLGGYGTSQTLANAIDYAYNLGVVIVASAGNDNIDANGVYPAAFWDVITVAATDSTDAKAWFSNWGSKIDVAAPGVDILSLRASGTSMGSPLNSDYTRANGTSMASPHVAGLAGLLLSAHPDYSNEDVRQAMRVSAHDTGTAGFDIYSGYGRIDAAAAVALTSVLEAKIQSPLNGAILKTAITVSGVARGAGFAGYTLDYGAGTSPSAWTVLQIGTSPVSGTLGVFDALSVANGTYIIRLTAVDVQGHKFVDRVQVMVLCVAITNPVPPKAPTSSTTFKLGVTIPIVGDAVGNPFRSYRVEWAQGLNPSYSWQSAGVALTGGGLSSILNGTLATWDTSTATQAGFYTIRLVVNSGGSSEVRTYVYLQPDLLSSNWPQWIDRGPCLNCGIVPAANAAGGLRLLLTSPNYSTTPGALWTFSPDGASVSKLQLPDPGYGAFHQLSVANLDGGVSEQAVVADNDRVRIYREDGSSFAFGAWGSPNFSNAQLTVERLTGNSEWFTVAFSSDFNANAGYIYAWRTNGGQVNTNFPIRVNDANDIRSWYNRVRLLVGDFDGDANNEIVVAEGLSSATFTLRMFRNDGSSRAWGVPVLTGMPWAMVAADLDHNGRLETIVVSRLSTKTFTVHVFQPDGAPRPGWPVALSNIYENTNAYLAVGDLNRDGREEIVVSNETVLYVFKDDGTSFSSAWPMRTGTVGYGAVVLGDVDGDGLPEIVTTRNDRVFISDPYFSYSQYLDAKLLAIRGDATVARSWQLTGMRGYDTYVGMVPAIGDFNQDGVTDIAVAYEVTGQGGLVPGVVTIFNTGAPFHPAVNDWPMLLQNARNNGTLKRAPKTNKRRGQITSQ